MALVKDKPIQVRFRAGEYSALEHWSRSRQVSVTDAMSVAVRQLTGMDAVPQREFVSLKGALRDAPVMREMENERRLELAADRDRM